MTLRNWLALIVVLGMISAYSCTKDKTGIPIPLACDGLDTTTNTYTLRVKDIIDGNCAYVGCHDGSFQFSMQGYDNAKTGFSNQPVICAIKHEGGCTPMPYSLPQLADSLIQRLECWKESGYPQ